MQCAAIVRACPDDVVWVLEYIGSRKGSGAGLSLLERLKQDAAENPCRVVLLEAMDSRGKSHDKLVAYYARNGFIDCGKRPQINSWPYKQSKKVKHDVYKKALDMIETGRLHKEAKDAVEGTGDAPKVRGGGGCRLESLGVIVFMRTFR